MLEFKSFEFSPFAENTYVLWDTDSLEAWIIDPGCYDLAEQHQLAEFITKGGLKPVKLLNTHCHLDHVFGNHFVYATYQLRPECHIGELPLLKRLLDVAAMYGVGNVAASPEPTKYLVEGEQLTLGQYQFECIFTPGHSPASLCFYCAAEHLLVGGDVLFLESIGRTDLPGGNHQILLEAIRTKLFVLPDETMVLPGHGPATTIRHEKMYNPFLI
jgi:hydroxyacylglutathione hydrolase